MPPLDPSPFMKPLRFASQFAGIGGWDLGFEDAGFTVTHQSEILPERQRLLQTYWPDVSLGEDIRHVSGSDLGSIDVLVGGFPCQDTSIAAPHRKGLAGKRSGLFYEFTRLLDEYLRLLDDSQAPIVALENTPGLLRSNGGRDMDAIALGMAELGYGWAYRVVDGRHFRSSRGGTLQRRPRLLLVGCAGDDYERAWRILGDRRAASEVAGTCPCGRPDTGPGTGAFVVGDELVRVWRKGARPRVALGLPGYRETWVDDGIANTLTGFDAGAPTRQTHLIGQGGGLRAPTMTEWERMSGFPDDWTESLGFTKGQRSNALGDCFQPTVARALGERIRAELQPA